MENDPNETEGRPNSDTNDESAAAAKEAAEKAAAQAKEAAANAAKVFKSMDVLSQVYLVALVVVVFFGLFFKSWSFSTGQKRAYSETEAAMVRTIEANVNAAADPLIQTGLWGSLSVLSAIAGIGIFVWAMMSKPKDAWVPLAVAGTAGLCALCLLIIWFTGFGRGPDIYSEATVSVGGTLLGFYVPLLAALAATATAVMRIMKA